MLEPNKERLFGIIGRTLDHSFSPAYFQEKFQKEGIQARYRTFPISSIDCVPELLIAHPSLCGLNVTTPYKEQVIPYLNQLTKAAEVIGAVNCVQFFQDTLIGHNTDWIGFSDSLYPLLQVHHRSALVLGNGGASKAVQYALSQLNLKYHTVSATPGKADWLYSELNSEIIQAHTIIINTTVLGTLGNGTPAIPCSALTPNHLLYDLVYNPATTDFLAQGMARGARIKNGLEMLHIQAEAAWTIWNQ
ncbi:MAG: shikimate dehydrogenase [Bacteroidetes bacterium]|nr:shikimate dehydrogenase [Bacteroidota bacterium]